MISERKQQERLLRKQRIIDAALSVFDSCGIDKTTIDEIGHTIHPHPTLSETIMEAAHGAHGQAIHM